MTYLIIVSITCLVSFIILYADDIVLLAQSVGELQHILSVCERELSWLDMNINSKKSCCIRIGPRCNIECKNITTSRVQRLQSAVGH
jgi:hypothetical protein